MTFNLTVIETKLSLLAWRDAQLCAITAQFETAWPALEQAIDRHVAEMPLWKVAKAHVDMRQLAHRLIAPWAEDQGREAAARAQEGLSEILESLPRGSLSEHTRTALPALAGVGLIAASVVAVPAVVTYATVTTPLLLAGGTVIAALSLTGSSALGRAKRRTRDHLAERLKSHARTAVFGDGQAPSAPCLLNNLQALVLKAGQREMETA